MNGDLTIDQPIAREMPWPHADYTFAPLGYRDSLEGGGIVPTYAPGLPILMALLIFPFGECGPFLVVPLLGALLIWVTYKIGERVTGVAVTLGLAAAVLMASSPAFMFMLMWPMSDVPVAALFCSAVLAALTPMRARAFITGLLVGLAVLVRPNMAPMAAVFAGYLAWQDGNWRDRLITLDRLRSRLSAVGDRGGDHSYASVWRAVEVGLRRFQHAVCVVVPVDEPASVRDVVRGDADAVDAAVRRAVPRDLEAAGGAASEGGVLGAFAAGVWFC